jgi:uncharacterized protein
MHNLHGPATSQQRSASPTGVPDRIEVVDVLRGFALGGILIANMADFTSPFYYIPLSALWPEAWNLGVLAFIQIFVTGNFFTIFSFLFGLGLALQMLRLEARGVHFVPLYLRRQAILLCIGLAHGVLIWYGDILAAYALFGCLLLLFRRRPPMQLLVLSAVLIAAPLAVSITRMIVTPAAFTVAPVRGSIDPDAWNAAQQTIAVYARGSWSDILHQRMTELAINYHGWVGRNYGTTVFAMFLLGLAAGRADIFSHLDRYTALTRKLWSIGLLCACIMAVWTIASYIVVADSPTWDLYYFQFSKIAHVFICLFYITSVILLARQRRWKRGLSLLAAPGRMALTNYLLQSMVFTTLFNSYGLGLFGAVSPLIGFGVSIVFFAGQVLLSNWFLSRFKFGPAEWVWKSLTYGKRQPFVRTH